MFTSNTAAGGPTPVVHTAPSARLGSSHDGGRSIKRVSEAGRSERESERVRERVARCFSGLLMAKKKNQDL